MSVAAGAMRNSSRPLKIPTMNGMPKCETCSAITSTGNSSTPSV
jgi:hypothetical protein